MRDATINFPKAFAPEDILVTRIVHGVSGTSLGRRELADVIEVTWGRETQSSVEIHINGVFVADGSTFCDCGKLGSSLAEALEDWSDRREEYGATCEDRFEVSVVSVIRDTPTLGYSHDDFLGHKCYFKLPDSAFFLGIPDEGIDGVPSEDLRTLSAVQHSRTKTASSLWSDVENTAAAAAFLERAMEESRTETDTIPAYG